MTTHPGSCLSGAVHFEVDLDLQGRATRCNCTLCTKLGITGANVKPAQFRLLRGEDALTAWARHPEIAQRFFCKHCGTPCFSRGDFPAMGGAFVGVVVNTLDDVDVGALLIRHWDGRHDNWQAGLRDTPWPV